ncbi:DUF2905 domain-containing protein [Microbacteriaceae bacterium 4G12]
MDVSKLLFTLGIVFLVLGVIWKFIGRRPGDIFIKKGNVTFYFPIVTCILISVLLSAILYIIGRFK